jgi:hypothetical protein
MYESDSVEDSYRATIKITVLCISILIFKLCPLGVNNIEIRVHGLWKTKIILEQKKIKL